MQHREQRTHDHRPQHQAGRHFTHDSGLACVAQQPSAYARSRQNDDELQEQGEIRHGQTPIDVLRAILAANLSRRSGPAEVAMVGRFWPTSARLCRVRLSYTQPATRDTVGLPSPFSLSRTMAPYRARRIRSLHPAQLATRARTAGAAMGECLADSEAFAGAGERDPGRVPGSACRPQGARQRDGR